MGSISFNKNLKVFTVLTASLLCLSFPLRNKPEVATSFEVVKEIKRLPNSFTQGFEIYNNELYESSGLYGKSWIARFSLPDYKLVQDQSIHDHYFAEGLTVLNDKLYMLTYKASQGFVLNPTDFSVTDQKSYSGEGWGLANDGKNLIMSNGSSLINFLDPKDFSIQRSIDIGRTEINELEYAKGYIWANIWFSNSILKIDPSNGEIVKEYDLSNLVPENLEIEAVLNGIAYDERQDLFYITGKLWPVIYLVKFND